jgi:hypothetical protein
MAYFAAGCQPFLVSWPLSFAAFQFRDPPHSRVSRPLGRATAGVPCSREATSLEALQAGNLPNLWILFVRPLTQASHNSVNRAS